MFIFTGQVMKKKLEFQRDGLTIRGHAWKKDRGNPQHAVILSHGFLANERMCYTYARLLADLGFLAVTFDFCGGGLHSKSDGFSKDMTVFTEKDDLIAVVKGVEEQFQTKGISLLGCSQGGMVSAMVAKEPAICIDRLILMYPALCIPDDARKGKMMFYRFDPDHIPDVLGCFPIRLGGDYARTVINQDAFDMIAGFNGPVLYMHGTDDRIVNISYARKGKNLFAGCEYHEIAGGGHGFRGKYDRQACEILASYMTKTIL